MMRASRCVPPAPGKTPIVVSVSAMVALPLSTRRSQASASSQPPPMA